MRTLALVTCLLVLAPAAVAQKTFAYHGADGDTHQGHFDTMSASGYRMIAFTSYGTVASPRYAAVWIQRRGPAFVGFHGLDGNAYQQLLDDNAQTHTPRLLSAVGSASDARFSGVLEVAKHGIRARHGIDFAELEQEIEAAAALRWRMTTVDAYGDAQDTRYVVAFEPNDTDKYGWGIYGADSGTEHNAQFAAMAAGYARAVNVAMNHDGSHFITLWYDTDVGPWAAHSGMSASEYDSKVQSYARAGWYPINVHAAGGGSKTEFAAIFAATDVPKQRQWSETGPFVPELVAFDDWAKDFLQGAGVRSGMLCVVKDQRLVLARAYTWAEAGYPQAQPDSLFRIASLSKPLTSIAIHQEMQQAPQTFGYATPMAGLFGNPVFADPRSNAITMRHLLTHQAGFDSSASLEPMFADTTIASALGVALPVNPDQIRTYMQGQPLDYTPGTATVYSNYGFSLLGRVLEALHPGQSYEQVLQAQLFAPLGITRAVLGGSTVAQILPGEVRYHPRRLRTAQSVVDPQQGWVPLRYGGWNHANLDAHGGWVLAAPDYAKVLASFDLGAQNPILGAALTQSMWTSEPGGFAKGWFEVDVSAPAGGTMKMFAHTGGLGGSVSFAGRREDGVSFVFFTNGSDDCRTISGDALSVVANSIPAWPAHDLFPQFGLPAFKHTPGSIKSFGQACPGSNGTPGLSYIGVAETGAQLSMVLTSAPPATTAYFLLGNQVSISLAPWFAPLCTLYSMPVLTLPVPTSGVGTAVAPLTLPSSSSFIGARWAAQYLILDPAASSAGLSATNGLDLRIGGWSGM